MINKNDLGGKLPKDSWCNQHAIQADREAIFSSPEYLQSVYEEYGRQDQFYPGVYAQEAHRTLHETQLFQNNPEMLLQKTHELLQTFGADTSLLNQPIGFHHWTRWGKKNRYSAKLFYGANGDDGLAFKDFKSNDKLKVVFFKDDNTLSFQELEDRKAAREKAYTSSLIELRARQAEVADEALKLWKSTKETGVSKYLAKKQIEAYGVRYGQDKHGRFLAIPLYDKLFGKLKPC